MFVKIHQIEFENMNYKRPRMANPEMMWTSHPFAIKASSILTIEPLSYAVALDGPVVYELEDEYRRNMADMSIVSFKNPEMGDEIFYGMVTLGFDELLEYVNHGKKPSDKELEEDYLKYRAMRKPKCKYMEV